MKTSKLSTDSSLISTSDNDSNTSLTSEQVGSTQKKVNSNSNGSSQMQLLGLAKKFVIDGALISAEKQMPLEERSKKRERVNHLRQQQNLEAIMQRAMQYCSENSISDRADQDWFSNFLNLAEGISNKTMQDLWAKIVRDLLVQL